MWMMQEMCVMMQKCDVTHSRWDANHVEKTFTSDQLTSFTYITWLIHTEIWILSKKTLTNHRLTWFTYATWLIHAEIWTMSKKHSRVCDLSAFVLRCKTPKHFWIEWCSSQRLVFFLKKIVLQRKQSWTKHSYSILIILSHSKWNESCHRET